jgi:L-ascorbate metabolism protein UlaG (beta-lactamase superfamily)
MEGILMGEALEKEYNGFVGTVKGTAIGDDPVFGGQLNWRRNAKEVTMEGRERTVESIPFSVDLNNNGFMDRLTNGKTLEQALRGLFASQTWKKLEADPAFTTDRRVTDRPLKEVMKLPGPTMVRVLHDYYDHLAQHQVEMSTSPAAAKWRQLRDASVAKQNEQTIESLTTRAQGMFGQ